MYVQKKASAFTLSQTAVLSQYWQQSTPPRILIILTHRVRNVSLNILSQVVIMPCSQRVYQFCQYVCNTQKYLSETIDSLETFELCLSVRQSVLPSVVITIASERKELRTSNIANRLPLAIGRLKMGYIGTRSGTSHLNQTGIPGSWAHGKFDSYQI